MTIWLFYQDEKERHSKPFVTIDHALEWCEEHKFKLIDIAVSVRDVLREARG